MPYLDVPDFRRKKGADRNETTILFFIYLPGIVQDIARAACWHNKHFALYFW